MSEQSRTAASGNFGGHCPIHHNLFPCWQCNTFNYQAPPNPGLFQFGVFFKWTCPECLTEIYATTDAGLSYQRNIHVGFCPAHSEGAPR